MRKKITVVFDDVIYKKLRIIRAQKIRTRATNVSFSTTINEVLRGKFD